MLNGYTANLPADCLLNAGVLFYTKGTSYLAIGVTDGAPDFDPGTELGEIMFDNRAPSRLKGLTRRVGFAPVVKGVMKEFGPSASGNQIALLEPGESEATVGSVTTLTPEPAGAPFTSGMYVSDLRLVFERASGGYAAIYFPLAICRKWTKKGVDKKEAQISFEFEAIGDPVNDLGTGPYAIEIRTALPTGTPTTPSALFTAFNSLSSGGLGGTMLAFYAKGVNQTILANGDGSLPSPGTASSTGFWCTKWDDAVSPNLGKHFRPSAGVNNGNGAPCLVTGEICGIGLELPDTTGLTGGGTFHADPGKKTDAAIPGSGNLRAILGDYSAGITWGGVGKLLDGSSHVQVGEDADANKVDGFGDVIGNTPGLRNSVLWDDGSGHGAAFSGASGGSPLVHWQMGVNRTTEPEAVGGIWENWTFPLIGRDITMPFYAGTNDLLASGRRLRLGGSYGNSRVGAQRAQHVFYVLKGHANAAQTKLLCDYFDTYYSTYNDTRRLGYLLGDSEFVMKVDLNDMLAVQTNENGGPAISNFGYIPLAFTGMRPQLMIHPLTYYLRGLDFSQRPTAGVPIVFSEWINATPAAETLTDAIAQNYYVADVLRAMNPTRVRIAMHNMTYADDLFDSQQTLNDPAINNNLVANAVSAGHADVLIDYLRSVMWNSSAQFYTSNGDYNRSNSVWDGIHPFHVGQKLWRARLRVAFRAAMGEDVSNVTVESFSSLPVVNLSAGTPTATPSWTAKNNSNSTLGGKTYTFSSWKHVPGQSHDDEVLDTSICTVNASTGLITRVAAGVALVLADLDDGGRGLCVVVCS